MCGIAGLLSVDTNINRASGIVQSMTDAIRHRGPDAGAVQSYQAGGQICVLGHRRLSIIDLSDAAIQPMQSPCGQYSLIFNGEIYNFKDLKADLKASGIRFQTTSDTEVLLYALIDWGLEQTLSQISGMFAFAFWDHKAASLSIARDRFGKKPLYIGNLGGDIVFASELRAFHQHPGFQKRINPKAQDQYFRYGCLTAPMTIFDGIYQLPPAYMAVLKASDDPVKRFRPYWSARRKAREGIDDPVSSDPLAYLKAKLDDAVKKRMIADVPLGAFLSGGIDSSLVVARMQAFSTRPVKTFSIGFTESGYDESQAAKAVARHLKTEHFEKICTEKDALDLVPRLSQMFDEPFADPSALPSFLVAEFARQHVTVALSGDGGDEVFGGYNRHVHAPKIWQRLKSVPYPLRRALAGFLSAIPQNLTDKLLSSHPQAGLRLHKLARLIRQKDRNGTYATLTQVWPGHPDWTLEPDLDFSQSMMLADTLYYLPSDILTKLDRTTMAVSLEGRCPLLDQDLYEAACRVPPDFKIRGDKGKWILREILAETLPRELFERPKQGFTIPLDRWLRGSLKDWGSDLIERSDRKNDLTPIWQQHVKGRGDYAMRLWTALIFEDWKQNWL